ncbi:MAG: PEP-utilizing enzyme [Ardenticatenaceae bacterium]|nr:PEP-utilizing enzyme [Ardenticatenaceae bacterium]
MVQQSDRSTRAFDLNHGAPQSIDGPQPLVLPLHELGRGDLAVAGGKGAHLGELIRAGFPVPAGFVVTTAAYDRFVTRNGLGATITRVLREEPGSGAAIRGGFEGAPIPEEVERKILAAYLQLGQGAVAVRSSATAEDLPEAAFAGQQDTFLNVIGEEALLDAVRGCWASLWTDRAIAYRQRQGLNRQTVKLAVVVQCMVVAEAAGVMFTANPVTGARDEVGIDACPGLGEAIVAGLVTPDHFVLRKRRWGWSIAERHLGRHEVIIRARSGGGTTRVGRSTTAGVPVLSDRSLRELAGQGAAIERHFGCPQDVEWAWAGRKLFIVQARPITALPEAPPHPSRPVKMLAAMFAEMFPVRPYPLDQTTWVHAISDAAVVPIFSLIGLAAPSIEQMFVEQDGVVVRFSGRVAFRPTPAILLAPARLLWLARRYDPVHWRADPLLTEARARARALEARDLQELSCEGLLATVREALALTLPLAGEPRRRYYPRALLAAGLLRVVLALPGRGDRFGTFLSGVESTTLEANRALEALATRIRSDPTLADAVARHEAADLRGALEAQPSGRAFLAELQAFLDRYGHREIVLSTVLRPTWKDAPEVVLGIVKGLATTQPPPAAGRPAWEVARDEILAHPVLRLRPLRAAFLGLLTAARCLGQIREDTHFYATLILPILRRALLELGQRLVTVGVLDAPEDVFHLKRDELERVVGTWPPPPQLAAEMRSLLQRRKEGRAALEATPLVDPQLYRQLEPVGDALLRGTAGSPGVAVGPVRVIRDVSEFSRLRSGEVLVAPYTNPAWTPLFQRAVAVVVDSGAAGSHAAIVAREYGIPAVMGTIDGTRRLLDGQQVRVDGDRGLVFSTTSPSTGPDVQEQPG